MSAWNSGLDECIRTIALGFDDDKIPEVAEAALASFCDKYKSPILNTVLGMAPDFDEYTRESIFLLVVERVWMGAPKYTGKPKKQKKSGSKDDVAWSWVSTITRNVVRDKVSSDKKQADRESLEIEISPDDQDPDPHPLDKHVDENPPSVEKLLDHRGGFLEFIETLSERDSRILDMLLSGKTQRYIAKHFNRTDAWASQVIRDLKARAKKYIN